MASLTVRNLPDETHRALRMLAASHGRSTEAEIRAILETAVRSERRIKLGSLLAEIGREAGGVDLDIGRDKTPTEPVIQTFSPGSTHNPLSHFTSRPSPWRNCDTALRPCLKADAGRCCIPVSRGVFFRCSPGASCPLMNLRRVPMPRYVHTLAPPG